MKTEHLTIKYLNNLIEQDHQPIRFRNKFYRSSRTNKKIKREAYLVLKKVFALLARKSIRKFLRYFF